MIGMLVVVGMLVWAAATLLVDMYRRLRLPPSHRSGQYEQLARHQLRTIADEAEEWLRSR
ncbi:MAG: hypothetical protein ACRDYY_03570 [Acidimicrobiales bacterium]